MSNNPVNNHTSVEKDSNRLRLVAQQYSGPLPHPDVLRGYNDIVPNAAERILVMAEEDAKHQQKMEFAALNAHRNERRLGQVLGFSIGLAALLATLVALFLGYDNVALVLGGSTLLGLVAVFVTGRLLVAKGAGSPAPENH